MTLDDLEQATIVYIRQNETTPIGSVFQRSAEWYKSQGYDTKYFDIFLELCYLDFCDTIRASLFDADHEMSKLEM
jgi:hypothetical protein